MKKVTKEKNEKLKRQTKVVVFLLVLVFALLTLPFSYSLERWFFFDFEYKEINALDLEMHFVDVGQGTAVLVRFDNNKTMLVDSGHKTAENRLLTYMNNIFFKGHKKQLDYIVVTHGDGDHCGNIISVMNRFGCNKIYLPHLNDDKGLYAEILLRVEKEKSKGLEVEISRAGELVVEGKTSISWLTPEKDYYADENNYSPIMIFEYQSRKFMLTGDANSNVGEREAIENISYTDIDVDVLSLSHHGSKNGTSSEFLEHVKPEFVVISVGKNSYGHPADDLLARLLLYDRMYGTNLFNDYKTTLNHGNVIYGVLPSGIIMDYYVQSADAYFFVEWFVVVIIAVATLAIIIFASEIKGIRKLIIKKYYIKKTTKINERKKAKSKKKHIVID